MDCDSPDALPAALDLAGVDSGPHAHAEPECRILHRARRGNRLRRPGERGEESVSGLLDQASAGLVNRLLRRALVTVEHRLPGGVPHFGCAFRGGDEVGKEDRRELSIADLVGARLRFT